ncbi:MAG: DNA recombination-mediator protein A, partial [Cyanobacteriota bacterium]
MTRSLDLPALDRIDTLAQELAMLQDTGKRRIAILGSRHVPVVSIHLVELVARARAQEGHSLITAGAQGVTAAVIRGVLAVDPGRLT